jgi:hypothetical protein
VEQPWKELRGIERAMERSRRATNGENYDEGGSAKKGRRKWNQSQRYRELARRRRERERRLAAERKRAHGEVANRILGQGIEIRTEQLSYRSLQRNYGRSVKVRGPGWFVSTLRRKAASAGGEVVELATKLRLSQFDHSSGEYVKKPLNQRMHVFGRSGMEAVQRDLYSALLAKCCVRITSTSVRSQRPGRLRNRCCDGRWRGRKNPRVGRALLCPAFYRTPERVVRRREMQIYARPWTL